MFLVFLVPVSTAARLPFQQVCFTSLMFPVAGEYDCLFFQFHLALGTSVQFFTGQVRPEAQGTIPTGALIVLTNYEFCDTHLAVQLCFECLPICIPVLTCFLQVFVDMSAQSVDCVLPVLG